MSLETLLQRDDLWRGRSLAEAAPSGLSTGHEGLDALLPGGGWARGALTELLVAREGLGELSLLLPALARLTHQGTWTACIGPPHLPYAPALAAAGLELSRLLVVRPADPEDRLWALEQTLRSEACGAVLGWGDARMTDRALRRLQLAAEAGDCTAFLFRPEAAAGHASPAPFRLRITAGPQVQLLKCRGAPAGRTVPLGGHAVA